MKSETIGAAREDDDQAETTVRPFPQRRMDAEPAERPEAFEREPDRAPELPRPDAAAPAEAAPETPKKKSRLRKVILPVVAAAILAGAGYYGYDYWTVGRFMISTDDAYLQADLAAIAPKIQGYVETVAVAENQHVKAGDVLVRLDAGDYRIALDEAKAKIVSQQATLDRIDAQTKAAEAAVQEAVARKQAMSATLENATASADRARRLLDAKYASQAQADDAEAALASAKANAAGADAAIVSAKANVGVLKAQRAEAESQMRSLQLGVDQARRNLDQTVLKAPYDGVFGNRSVEPGDLVSPGQKLGAIVPTERVYIEANFKETQLADLVPGEKVKVTVDALGGKEFEGTVSSLAPASGSIFSLLPAENATGNFTKVVQRVPVRIDLPKDVLASGRLRAGLSVVVDVDSRTAPDGAATSLTAAK